MRFARAVLPIKLRFQTIAMPWDITLSAPCPPLWMDGGVCAMHMYACCRLNRLVNYSCLLFVSIRSCQTKQLFWHVFLVFGTESVWASYVIELKERKRNNWKDCSLVRQLFPLLCLMGNFHGVLDGCGLFHVWYYYFVDVPYLIIYTYATSVQNNQLFHPSACIFSLIPRP